MRILWPRVLRTQTPLARLILRDKSPEGHFVNSRIPESAGDPRQTQSSIRQAADAFFGGDKARLECSACARRVPAQLRAKSIVRLIPSPPTGERSPTRNLGVVENPPLGKTCGALGQDILRACPNT
jgi:hypothetical protein